MVKCKLLVWVALPLLFCAAILLFSPAGAAPGGGTALVVQGGSGKSGDNVSVTVSLQGVKNLSGVEGLSGGEFEIHYDPAAASIEKISKGSALGAGFMFIENKNYSDSSAKVTLAAVSGLITEDGDLCKIAFTLKKTGSLEITLKEIAFYDQDVRPLTAGAVSSLPAEAPPGEDQDPPAAEAPSAGGVTSVELLPPGDAVPPSGDRPGAGTPGDDTSSAGPGDGKESGDEGDDHPNAGPAGQEKDAMPGPGTGAPGWLLPAAVLAALVVIAAVAYCCYRRRSRVKKESQSS